MLRITIHDKPESLTFQLEGKLAGESVRVLEECWQSAPPRQGKAKVRVDLNGVTSIDVAGQSCLADLHHEGAELVAADCLMSAIVNEITLGPGSGDWS